DRPALPRTLLLAIREAVDEVIGVPERIEAEILGHARHLREVAPARRRPAHLPLGVGQDEPDFQRSRARSVAIVPGCHSPNPSLKRRTLSATASLPTKIARGRA